MEEVGSLVLACVSVEPEHRSAERRCPRLMASPAGAIHPGQSPVISTLVLPTLPDVGSRLPVLRSACPHTRNEAPFGTQNHGSLAAWCADMRRQQRAKLA